VARASIFAKRWPNRSSGLSSLNQYRLSRGASRRAALLIAHLCPIKSLFARGDPGATLRQPVLIQRGQTTSRVGESERPARGSKRAGLNASVLAPKTARGRAVTDVDGPLPVRAVRHAARFVRLACVVRGGLQPMTSAADVTFGRSEELTDVWRAESRGERTNAYRPGRGATQASRVGRRAKSYRGIARTRGAHDRGNMPRVRVPYSRNLQFPPVGDPGSAPRLS
jgi:hypothetical protein